MNIQRPTLASLIPAFIVMVFLVLPLISIIPVSFTPKSYLSMPNGDWSLKHYENIFTSTEWLSSIGYSVVIAVIASSIATFLATSFSVGVWYLRSRWTAVLVGLVLLPMLVPPVISGMALFFLETNLSEIIPWLGYDTVGGVIVAHVIMIVPYGVVTILVALSQFDRRIVLAARNLGSSITRTTFSIVLPNIKLGVLATMLLTFVLSWEEAAVTIFVTSVNVITLPRRIWTSLRSAFDPTIASISGLLIFIIVLIVVSRALIPYIRQAVRHQHEV